MNLVADGILLDYHWNDKKLQGTRRRLAEADEPAVVDQPVTSRAGRGRDVFIGIDVWGRGMINHYGGWNTRLAVDTVR